MKSLSTHRYDVAVIGGGSAGLGVARAAAERGRSVVVFERGVCGRGASDNSLRIVHGGFRYLQSLHFARVVESLRAQADLRVEFPDLVTPLPCLMPLDGRGLKSRWPVTGAQILFRAIAAVTVGRAPRTAILDRAAAEAEAPILRGSAPHGALLWTDAVMPDPRALLARLVDLLRARGVEISERAGVTRVHDHGGRVEVTLDSGETLEAGVLVNAAGAGIGAVARSDGGGWPPVGGWARAFNVVVRPLLEKHYGVALEGNGRLLFAVPRGEHTAIGTGYLPAGDGPNHTIAESEVAAFLIEASRNLREPLTLSDVVSVESGLLPMVGLKEGAPQLYGAERIERAGRVVTVVSTKYTTFQEQGRKAARLIERILG